MRHTYDASTRFDPSNKVYGPVGDADEAVGRLAAALGYCMRIRSGRPLRLWELKEFDQAIEDAKVGVETYGNLIVDATGHDYDYCARKLQMYRSRYDDFRRWRNQTRRVSAAAE